ncbi:MAG TPA: ATP-binding cassette domain-containing protein, partial [Lacunisphaera sp.]|nr:ATP-binding cassette domain-containing protein [Lacunisphaera sp.]
MTGGVSKWLTFTNASKHNIRNLTFTLPLQRLVCLSGVSGSGKSTLLDNVICQGLLTQRSLMTEDPAEIEAVKSDLNFSEVVLVDQSPLSRTPRSNPALYCEAWELIRELYATVPAAQEAGFNASSFSFNSGDGRCDNCQGLGSERVEMQFLSDVFVPCPICEGKRFKSEVLAIQWHGHSVADILATNVGDALKVFAGEPEIHRRLAALDEVGLGYLPLGQPLNTLSGGESQRLKLVRYLSEFTDEGSESRIENQKSKISAGALLLLDEPTTGLHRHDVKRLLAVLQRIVDRGHSVVVIEHNLDVLKSADWILEVGPEAGAQGGRIIAEGPPEAIAKAATATSPFL